MVRPRYHSCHMRDDKPHEAYRAAYRHRYAYERRNGYQHYELYAADVDAYVPCVVLAYGEGVKLRAQLSSTAAQTAKAAAIVTAFP